jgi:phospholipase C
MAQTIKHIVVLMLENRSFDHMLGFLKAPDYPIDGLNGTESNPRSAADHTPVPVTRDGAVGLPIDAGHQFGDTNVQLFFNPAGPPVAPGEQPNSGFVQSYREQKHVTPDTASRIMSCFVPSDVPALAGLAREFAICDQWFSSVPGPTWPNRFFVHAATSKGVVSNDFTVNFDMRTIFESLSDAGRTWKVYSHDFPLTQLFGRLLQSPFEDNWDSIGGFRRDCADGTLPHYSFIEPKYTRLFGHANSQHPPEDIGPGDQLIDDVYHAVRTSPAWNDVMLVITYDEHGGTFDHVTPPAAVPPDNHRKLFAFDRLGVRVPAVIVSPWIPRGTIVHDSVFDHSAVPATIKTVFGLPAFLTNRDAAAATFEGVASLAAPRTETPLRFRSASSRRLTEWGDEVASLHDVRMLLATGDTSAAPISDLQLSMVELARLLAVRFEQLDVAPLDLLRPMVTEHDAAVYLRQVAARIRASLRRSERRGFGGRQFAAPTVTLESGATIARPSKLHVVQDDSGFWQLSLEHPDGTLQLLAWQSLSARHLEDEAHDLVRGGRYPNATVVIDPPRRAVPQAAAGWPADYSKPLPRRAGE